MDFPEAREGLREVIAWARREFREGERTKWVKRLGKGRISHRFANALGNDLEEKGISVPWRKGGNANYFLAEIEDRAVLVSIFASHEHWWEKPSAGFFSIVRKSMERDLTCRWGVALFRVPDGDGVWIEGAVYEETFKWPETLNESHVRQAVEKKVARKFSDKVDLINVIRKWLDPRRKLYKRD